MKDLLDWFGLKAFPFGKNLKTQDVLEAEPFNEAMARFDNIKRLGGILFLTGDPRTVKNLAIRRCVDTLIKTLFKRYNTPLSLLNRADPLYHLNRFLRLPPRRFKRSPMGRSKSPLLNPRRVLERLSS